MTLQEYEARFEHNLIKTRSVKLAQALCAAYRNEYIIQFPHAQWHGVKRSLFDKEREIANRVLGVALAHETS